jgi:ATP-dependent helicase/DNAse subunit B
VIKELILVKKYDPLQKEILEEFKQSSSNLSEVSYLSLPTLNLIDEARAKILSEDVSVLIKSNIVSLQWIAQNILDKKAVYQVISFEETLALVSKVVLKLQKNNQLVWFSQLDSLVETTQEIWGIIASIKRNNMTNEILLDDLSDKERDIALIYNEYQRELFSRNLLDQEEVIKQATKELEQSEYNLKGNKLIIYDYQLSLADVNFLLALSNNFKTVKVFLHFDRTRKEIFSTVNESIKKLREAEFKLFEQDNEENTLESNLFKSESADVSLELNVSGAYTKLLEIKNAFREIKKLILSGVDPKNIALVSYNIDSYREIVEKVASEFETPVENLSSSLGKEVFTKQLMFLFSLVKEDFSKVSFLEFLRLDIDWPEEIKANILAKYIKLAPYDGPLSEWQQGVFMLQNIKDKDMIFTHDELKDISSSLYNIGQIFKMIPNKGSYNDFYVSYKRVKEKLNFSSYMEKELKRLESFQAEKLYSIEAQFNQFLGEEDQLNLWPEEMTFSEFLEIIKTVLSFAKFSLGRNNYECVKVYNPMQVAGLDLDYVFLIGANEGVIPSSSHSWIRGIDNDDLKLLNVENAEDELSYQKATFLRLIGSAKKALYVSYLKENYAGDEGYLSPFVVDILDLTNREEVINRVIWPSINKAASTKEYQEILAKEKQLSLLGQNIASLYEIEEFRANADASVYNGVINSPDLKEALKNKFSDYFTMSTTMLEEYGKCPFAFLLKRVFMLEETEEFEPGLTPMIRGNILHDVLANFLSEYLNRSLREEDLGEYLIKIDNYLQLKLSELVHTSAISSHWVELERKRFTYILNEWLSSEIELQKESGFRPAMLEKSFNYQLENRGILKYMGFVDRIDKDSDRFIIYDYKSGMPPKLEDVKEGIAFQLPLYIKACKEIFNMENICGGGYYSLGSNFNRNSGMWVKECLADLALNSSIKDKLPFEEWNELLEETIEKAYDYRELMRDGYYPLNPKKIPTFCSYCTYKDICRLTGKLSSRLEDSDEVYR